MQAIDLAFFDQGLVNCTRKMSAAGVSQLHIALFEEMYRKSLFDGQSYLSEKDILPVSRNDMASLFELEAYADNGKELLKSLAVIKLNGGLGTTMGLRKAKSLLSVKNGFSFLDIILNQVESLRQRYQTPVPLLFMNSFNTDIDTIAALGSFSNGASGIPTTFVQGKFVKIDATTREPATCLHKPEAEWNPPGHGDVYLSLTSSGVLDLLLSKGIKYAFISNSDNLGATVAPEILGYMEKNHIPFLMEVTNRTKQDSKGGHLAKKRNGNFVLREVAQCSPDDLVHFQNIEKYSLFNTNSLWLNLIALKKCIESGIHLDAICNPKKCDPTDASSQDVLQLEIAMGSLISHYPAAEILEVPRTRFLPVKTNEDFNKIRSNQFVLNADWCLVQKS